MDGFVGFEKCRSSSVWGGTDMDCVAVIVVEKEDVVVAWARGNNEVAHEIGECFAGACVPDSCVAEF